MILEAKARSGHVKPFSTVLARLVPAIRVLPVEARCLSPDMRGSLSAGACPRRWGPRRMTRLGVRARA